MAVDPGLSLDCRSGRSGGPAAARELTRSGGEGYLRRIMPVPINYKLLHGQAVPPFCCADAAVAELVKIGFANCVLNTAMICRLLQTITNFRRGGKKSIHFGCQSVYILA